jgi:hypothetical protein
MKHNAFMSHFLSMYLTARVRLPVGQVPRQKDLFFCPHQKNFSCLFIQ